MAKQKFKGFDGHGNERRNPKPHHLYEIIDKVDDSVYKYGISANPIDEEGYSYRMRRQVKIGNSFVGWLSNDQIITSRFMLILLPLFFPLKSVIVSTILLLLKKI